MSRLPDQDARDLILTDLEHNFMVEAGAGSGKTASLVARILRLITTGTCEIGNVAAVTFTRKAAAEMRQRLQEALEDELRSACSDIVAKRVMSALEGLHTAFIGTIHSFCARLLRERPVEAGLGADFREIEGLEETLLQRQAWSEYLLRIRLEHPEILDNLDDLDVSPADLVSAYERIVLYPEVKMVTGAAEAPDLSEAGGCLARFLGVAEKHMPEQEPENGWDELQAIVVRARRWRAAFNLGDRRYFLRLLSGMERKVKPTLNRWPTPDGAREVASAFEEFRSRAVEPVLRAWREYRHRAIIDFLLPAAVHYSEVRQRLNRVNFQDLLMKAASMLRENPGVRTYFQEKYTRLFVDEFQDTDPVQAEIMFYLAGEDASGRDWTRLPLRSGALFVVGDPKQSIYRFRRADIDTFDLVKTRIVETGGRAVCLTSNFRSVPEIVDWVNPCFEGLFRAAGLPYQPDYTGMSAVRESGRGQPEGGASCGVMRLELAGARRQEDVVKEDAYRIASWVRRCLDGGLTLHSTPEEIGHGLGDRAVPEDFMILVMFKRNMDVYARALADQGIPCAISGESGIRRSRVLREFHVVLRCLADPGNPVYLVAALRGIFFGVSDKQLYQFRQAGGRLCFLSPLPGDAAGVFRDAWDRLRLYWEWSRDLPPSAAIERLACDLGALAFSRAGEAFGGSGDTAGSVAQYLEAARRQEERGVTGFAEVLESLGQLLEEGAEEDVDIEGGRRPGVRLMNVHKAKGLEAPVVILANPSSNPRHEPDFHVRRQSGEALGYLSVWRRKNEYQSETLAAPEDWERFRDEEARYLEAERVRLLYVAATRARNLLVVSECPSRGSKNPWSPLDQYLERMPPVESFPDGVMDPAGAPRDATIPASGPGESGFTAACRRLEERLEGVRRPSYRHDSVTGITGGGSYPGGGGGGRGAAWGSLVHTMLAMAASRKGDLTSLIDDLATHEGLGVEEKEDLARTMRAIAASPFWRRVLESSELRVEVPFGVFERGVYLTGAIDLVFREASGWVVADYKSDEVESEERLQRLVEHYGPQVREYARRWAAVTREPVTECGIFFTTVCEWRRT